MKGINLEEYQDVFNAFVDNHSNGDEADVYHVELKRHHSLRVFENAQAIIEPLELESRFAKLCLLAAMFHDIGRFPQYSCYKTFLDKKSKDHGMLGCVALRTGKIFAELPENEQKILHSAVVLHNRRALPDHISPEVRTATQVVRDADKLDIIRVIVDHLDPEKEDSPVVLLSVKSHPEKYTQAVYDQVMAGQMVDYNHLCWTNDFKMLMCGWVFSFNYPVSLELLNEFRLLEDLLELLPATEAMDALRERVRVASMDPASCVGK